MVQAIVVGVVIGGLITVGLQRRATRANEREARSREQLAAIVLGEEMDAAIAALDLALSDDGAKWVVSMSESKTLSEAWREHGDALVGLGTERWEVISDAVNAMAPSYRLVSTSRQTEDLKRSLPERRELLVEGARILRSVHERPARKRSPNTDRIRSLLT